MVVGVAGERRTGGRIGAVSRVAAVVLAAGASVRMGRNKLLLTLGGETVVRRAARTAAAAGLDPVVVVTGHEREAVEAALHGLPCRTVFNSEHARGQHTSVGTGVAALAGDTDPPAAPSAAAPPAAAPQAAAPPADRCTAAIVILADMPFVTADMLRAVAERHAATGAPVVASRYGGETIAPPILYDRRLFGELTRMDRRCGRQVVQRHRADAVEVDWPEEMMRDLDRPSDYANARSALSARPPAAQAPDPLAAASEPAHG